MRTLLYIEDNEDNLYMLQLRFDVLGGYEIISATDGAAGLAMAAAERPDLILMDLNLPEVDGWEAARRLKADPLTRDIPIIALSAHAMAATASRRSPPAATISIPSPSNSIACWRRSNRPWPPRTGSLESSSLPPRFHSLFGQFSSLLDRFNSLFGRLGNLPTTDMKKQ